MTALVKLPRPPRPPTVPGMRQWKPNYGAPATAFAKKESGPPPQPGSWPGSDIEWIVNWWLTVRHIPFTYQQAFLGGRLLRGGQVADFVVPPNLVIGVQGEYWHYRTSALRGIALLAKVALQGEGYTVVYVRGVDLKERLDYTMERALLGIQLFSDT